MVINHVPANAPSHMRQTIGLESAAACTSMYNGCHPWAKDGPILLVVRVIVDICVKDGRGRWICVSQFFIHSINKTRPCNNNRGVTHMYKITHIYNKTQGYLYHRSNSTIQPKDSKTSALY
jgi:hypothetical protein